MAAPEFVPISPTDRPRLPWTSPAHVPAPWTLAERPAELANERQPSGPRFGNQGPDQGYALVIVDQLVDRLLLGHDERVEDAVAGGLGVALKRASLFGRAPVIHDWTVAFTIWGFFDASPPDELVALRRQLFASVAHWYEGMRVIADRVPAGVLRQPHTTVQADYPAKWREMTGG